MTKFAVKSGSRRVVALAGFLVTLAGFVVAAQFPQARLWGINWWSYFPTLMWPVILLAAGLAVYVIFSRVWEKGQSEQSRGATLGAMVICSLIFIVAFWFFRNRVHFLGDGYQLISALQIHPPFVELKNFGPMQLPHAVMDALGGPTTEHALLAYQIISILSGCLFMLAAYLLAREVTPTLKDRALMWLGLCTGGYILLFYGYVENYPAFLFSVLVFCWAGIAVDKGTLPRWWLLPALGLTVFLHIFGLALFVPALYQFLKASPPDSPSAKRKTRAIIMTVALVAAMIIGLYFYFTNLFVRFAFVPLIENALTVEGYTLLSGKHLLDWLNLIFVLVPGVVMFALVQGGTALRQVRAGVPGMRFLLLTAAALCCVSFFINPLLGMPRDWDLFSSAGVPLTILFFYSLAAGHSAASWRIAGLCILLNVLLLGPRVASQVQPEVGLDMAKQYILLDKSKNEPFSYVVVDYVNQAKGADSALALQSSWLGLWPDDRYVDTALSLTEENRYNQAASYYRRALTYNPMNRTAWSGLGNCLLETGRYDSAATILKIALGLNPYSAIIAGNLAYAHYYLKDYTAAEHYWLASRELDTAQTNSLVGLATLYGALDDNLKYAAYFDSIIVRKDAPAEYLLAAAIGYLHARQMDIGAKYLMRARDQGATESQIAEIIEKYPNVKPYL